MPSEDNEFDFHGLHIESLISAPLKAVASANSVLSKEQVSFILDFCFSKTQDKDIYDPVLIPLTITRSAPNHDDAQGNTKQHTMQFYIPLITLIPINNLSITKVNLDFGLELTHSLIHEDQEQTQNQKSSQGSKDSKVSLHGYFSSHSSPKGSKKADTKENETDKETITMKVEVDSIPLSNGLKCLIDYYSKAIYPVDEDQSNK